MKVRDCRVVITATIVTTAITVTIATPVRTMPRAVNRANRVKRTVATVARSRRRTWKPVMFAKPQATTRRKRNPVTSSSCAANAPAAAVTTNVRRSRKRRLAKSRVRRSVRASNLPRRNPRQLAQKVRVESAVVEPVAEIVPEAVVAEIAPHRSVKAELPVQGWRAWRTRRKMANPVKRTVCRVAHVVHLRVSGQRRRRYRDGTLSDPVAHAADRSLRIAGDGFR